MNAFPFCHLQLTICYPVPALCLLTVTDFDEWARSPGRLLTAIAVAADLCMTLDSDPHDPSLN